MLSFILRLLFECCLFLLFLYCLSSPLKLLYVAKICFLNHTRLFIIVKLFSFFLGCLRQGSITCLINYMLLFSEKPSQVMLMVELVGQNFAWLKFNLLNKTHRVIQYNITFSTQNKRVEMPPFTDMSRILKYNNLQTNTSYVATIQAINPTGNGPIFSINVTIICITGMQQQVLKVM